MNQTSRPLSAILRHQITPMMTMTMTAQQQKPNEIAKTIHHLLSQA
jgi:hypothetical protein